MSFFKDCYSHNYELYNNLISYHDYKKNIVPAIKEITPIENKIIADVGCGTGRLTSLLIEDAEKVYLCDGSEIMLRGAEKRLLPFPKSKYEIRQANTFNLPYEDNSFDILIEGWSLSFCIREVPLWDKLINELLRVLKTGGVLIIVETLGYGVTSPNCTNNYLNSFYSYLTNQKKFNSKWIRTDYKYENETQAILFSNAFFDYNITEALLANPQSTVPECTGFWWLEKK